MTNTPSADTSIPTLVPVTATTPVMGAGFDTNGVQNISWEINDGIIDETPIEPQEKPPQDAETLIEDDTPEIEPVEEEDEGDEDKEEKKKKNKPRNSAEKRIADLNRRIKQEQLEKTQAQAYAYSMAKEKENLEKALQKRTEETLTTNRDYLKERLKAAHEEGDSELVAEITDRLGQFNAEIRLNNQKSTQVVKQPPPQQVVQEDYRIPEDHPYAGVGEEWVKTNSWADPESHNFDQDMYEASDKFSITLMKQYKYEGRGDEIGSPQFFDDITDHVKDRFGITTRQRVQKPPVQKEKIQMTAPNSIVSPVNRPAVNAESQKSRNEVVLSPEQKEVAHKMSGSVRDKNGNRIYDKKQLEQIYINNMRG
jgi:hypothetical protein